jgi:predicted Zn-ribbon and HTH transcriptional regulator
LGISIGRLFFQLVILKWIRNVFSLYDMVTIRKDMILLLGNKEMDAREISSAVGVGEKEVYTHLNHISRSVKHQGKKLIIKPAECLGCGYVFEKRKRFTRPSRCPICKSEHMQSPMYRID